jgi:hypothetical protein
MQGDEIDFHVVVSGERRIKFWLLDLEKRDRMKDPGVDKRIKLKGI